MSKWQDVLPLPAPARSAKSFHYAEFDSQHELNHKSDIDTAGDDGRLVAALRAWNALTPAEKGKYEALAAEDQLRHAKQSAAHTRIADTINSAHLKIKALCDSSLFVALAHSTPTAAPTAAGDGKAGINGGGATDAKNTAAAGLDVKSAADGKKSGLKAGLRWDGEKWSQGAGEVVDLGEWLMGVYLGGGSLEGLSVGYVKDTHDQEDVKDPDKIVTWCGAFGAVPAQATEPKLPNWVARWQGGARAGPRGRPTILRARFMGANGATDEPTLIMDGMRVTDPQERARILKEYTFSDGIYGIGTKIPSESETKLAQLTTQAIHDKTRALWQSLTQ